MILAVETSCDETSAAVVHQGVVLSNHVASQIALHREYGGVVPELATREHLRHLRPVIQAALESAEITVADLEAVCATQGPGLPQALMIGLRAAQALAYSRDLPFLGVHHHEAHLYSPWITGAPPTAQWEQLEPHVSLIVSGGHTILVHVHGVLNHTVLGSTLDDAAGECFDKVAKLIGLPYPGGPEMDRLAQHGDARAHSFPRPLLRDAGDDFSFAGLKTSVRYFLQKHPALLEDRQAVCDLCASVQAAIVEVLVTKTVRAAGRLKVRTVTASGGVVANRALRSALEAECVGQDLQLRLAEKSFSTDNAGMVAVLGERLHQSRRAILPDVEVRPGWSLEELGRGLAAATSA